MKPRIFLGSSGLQEKLLQALARGLQDIADVEPWTTVPTRVWRCWRRLVELNPRSISPRLSSLRTTGRRLQRRQTQLPGQASPPGIYAGYRLRRHRLALETGR